MVFSKKKTNPVLPSALSFERVTSVIGPGINWKGDLKGRGGVRIEGTLEGDISMRGLVVIGESGRVTCEQIKADTLVVAGIVKANILATRLEIRATGRVWGDVVTTSFSTEDGAFLRGQIRMEDQIDLDIDGLPAETGQSEENLEQKEED